MATWTKIGKIKGAHGLKGEVEILVFSKDLSWSKKLSEIKLIKSEKSTKSLSSVDPEKIYKILSLRKKTKKNIDSLLVQLEGISDRTLAEGAIGLEVNIPSELLVSRKGETIFLSEVLNFKVVDVGNSSPIEVGLIEGFSSNGAQDLLEVSSNGKKIEIPFVEPFIEKIDYINKVIYMKLPEGLLEI